MTQDEFMVYWIRDFEKKHPEIISIWKDEIEINGIAPILDAALQEGKRTGEEILKMKSFWIMLRYCAEDNFKGAKDWLSFGINNSTSRPRVINSARSISNLFDFLNDKGLTPKDLQDIEFENILFGEGKAKEITTVVINDIKKKQPKEQTEQTLTGLKCSLSSKKAKELYLYLKGEYISQETLRPNFIALFDEGNLPVNFVRIEWILVQKRNKKQLNKKAVFDLLELAGVDMKQIDLPTMNYLICGSLKHSNWVGNKGTKKHSEAFNSLVEIFSKL